MLTEDNGQILTSDKRGSGQLVGWSSILRVSVRECVSASEDTLFALPASNFVSLISQFREFQEWFASLSNIQESLVVINSATQLMPQKSRIGRQICLINLLTVLLNLLIQGGFSA